MGEVAESFRVGKMSTIQEEMIDVFQAVKLTRAFLANDTTQAPFFQLSSPKPGITIFGTGRLFGCGLLVPLALRGLRFLGGLTNSIFCVDCMSWFIPYTPCLLVDPFVLLAVWF